MRILFVCTGNTCRSPMAAALLREALDRLGAGQDISISSAGLGAYSGDGPSEHSVAVMEARGIDISAHVAQRLTQGQVERADLILVMGSRHKAAILDAFPSAFAKVFTFREYAGASGSYGPAADISDPYGGSLLVYEETASELEQLALEVALRLRREREGKPMRVVIGNDHAGIGLVSVVTPILDGMGIEWEHIGTFSDVSVDYPDYAKKVAYAVSQGTFDRGLLICGTGIGMSIAANKVPGIRAALCQEPYSAALSRLHNDANVLCLGARTVGPGLAEEMVRVWFSTDFSGDRHQRRVDKLNNMGVQE